MFMLVYVNDIIITGSCLADVSKMITTLSSTFDSRQLGDLESRVGWAGVADSMYGRWARIWAG